MLWGSIGFGAGLILVVTTVFLASGTNGDVAARPELADTLFYIVALGSVLGLGASFMILRRMESAAYDADSVDAALAAVRTHGITALALAEMPTLAACASAYITGETLVLALGLPLFGLIWLTWPSDARVDSWIEKADR